jgi:sodium pump decarboxylase gamma subunit
MRSDMVKKLSKVLALSLVLVMCFATCAFAADSSTATVADVATQIQQFVISSADEYAQFTEDELKYVDDNSLGYSKELAEGFLSYVESDSLGEYIGVGDVTVSDDGNDQYTATAQVQFEKATVTIVYEFKSVLSQLVVYDVELSMKSTGDSGSIGSVMVKALQNTVIGIGVVFCMLAFMSIIIAQFKHVSTFEKWLASRKGGKDEASVGIDNGVAQIAETEANLTDDLELVAVITAAIAAYEGTAADSEDGFTVRSIRRVHF